MNSKKYISAMPGDSHVPMLVAESGITTRRVKNGYLVRVTGHHNKEASMDFRAGVALLGIMGAGLAAIGFMMLPHVASLDPRMAVFSMIGFGIAILASVSFMAAKEWTRCRDSYRGYYFLVADDNSIFEGMAWEKQFRKADREAVDPVRYGWTEVYDLKDRDALRRELGRFRPELLVIFA